MKKLSIFLLITALVTIVSLAATKKAKATKQHAKAAKTMVVKVGKVKIEMIEVEADTMTIQGKCHNVTAFHIGKTEVTQDLWNAVMDRNPSEFRGSTLPVDNISWNDCQTFVKKLNELTGKNFRLPTEIEWEFAARGGKLSKGYKYAGSNSLSTVAWYFNTREKRNDLKQTHPVATKAPNELGIYDMSGNVWEWCDDLYSADGKERVLRGGSWDDYAGFCEVRKRSYDAPTSRDYNFGLRLAL